MTENTNHYRELEERTTEFAKRVIRLCKELPNNTINRRLIDQIVRSAGSVGANYREANEALGKKDLAHRLRIARKECKETEHWLVLIEEANEEMKNRMAGLVKEGSEIRNILSAIISKVSTKEKFGD
ncbi:MAG: four helix bundle protein [Candidatus Moraniibacteriota bacterium]|nr:MAG: four helix bundle protein [Candidatus Moranbacteria bacterium]